MNRTINMQKFIAASGNKMQSMNTLELSKRGTKLQKKNESLIFVPETQREKDRLAISPDRSKSNMDVLIHEYHEGA